METTYYYVTGPSGAGKSTCLSIQRLIKRCVALDMDFVGYRDSSDESDWTIPLHAHTLLREIAVDSQNLVLGGGCDHRSQEHVETAIEKGAVVFFLIPEEEKLIANLKQRNRESSADLAAKIAAAQDSINSFKSMRAKYATFERVFEIKEAEEFFQFLLAKNLITVRSRERMDVNDYSKLAFDFLVSENLVEE